VTTVTANAMALAWGGQQGSATLTLPAGETVIEQSSTDCGSSPDQMRGHMWKETVATPGATVLGQDASLSTARPWAIIGVSIKPMPPTPPQPPGRFNAFEPTTVAGALTGVIRTKIAGNPVSLDVIAANSTRTAIDSAFTGTVKVEVLDASNNTGGMDANGCRSTWTVIQTLSNPTFAAGDLGRKNVSFTQTNSYRDVRVRVSYPTTSPTLIGCSNDNFAIRPGALVNFAVSDNDWQTAGTNRALTSTTFATVTHKAGRPMSLRASAVNATGTTVTTNYTGAPTSWLSACAGAACTSSFGTLTLASTFTAGQLSNDVASYDNVGSFALQLVDSTYASVDAYDTVGDCNANGSYVCTANINVGRFVPDNFAIALNTPAFGSGCGSFTYLGQKFNYATAPVITLTARNFAGGTTTLYNTLGSWFRITSASLTGKAYTTAAGTLDTSGAPGTDPVIAAAGSGTGTLTFSSGTGFFFPRTTPVAPFDAEISLAVNVIDADGVSYASNPARFGQASAGNGIAFSSGKPMRFGRLVIRNANGTQLLPLPVRVEAQYWSGAPTNAFITNTLDNCTSIASANVAMGNYTANLSGSPTCETAISGGGALGMGRRILLLAAPGSSNDGSVNLTVNLGAAASGSTCTTQGGAPGSATTANLPHLQGNWTGGAYDVNPSARATFGVYRGAEEIIFVRENF
jgi:MSHA biogenesis protein MshQ